MAYSLKFYWCTLTPTAMKLFQKYFLTRMSTDTSEKKVILLGNNRFELQLIKDILEMELPPEVRKLLRYSIEENNQLIRNFSQNGSNKLYFFPN